MDKILEFIDKIGPLFYVIIPAAFGVYYKLQEKIKERKKEVKVENTARNIEKYKVWEHEESQKVIRKIKDLCDYYKDKGHMDLVNYIQLENGTVASSKLCNMFISVLAEDDRYGDLPKLIKNFQRVPYSRVACWVDKVRDVKHQGLSCVAVEDSTNIDCCIAKVTENDLIKSSISAPLYDPNNILLGICVFYYSQINFNNQGIEITKKLMLEFQLSVQSIFLEYHIARKRKKKELNLTGGDVTC